LKQMAGDRKGKAKVDEQPKKKKRSREERDWERAHAATAIADRPQRPFQIRESRAATQGSRSQMQRHHQALRLCAILRVPGAQLRPHLLVVVLAPEVDALRGLEAILSHSQTQLLR